MKSNMTAHPHFQIPPRGIKRMLSAPKSHACEEAKATAHQWLQKVPETAPGLHADVTIPIQSVGPGS